ncbi:hypothetical protein M422DRAFT_778328 [Sphaerobolus stellatus SS14]|uniref:Unplaced genomic scaffold SPHSTscaffold_30, whole genome shotgun sequence n=1 Tax=Sphaerobolus stellatus (strain SS14) TaxID=990650 RepID=A0A0C9VV45_SPHS4|nr:hypothetical protein M422DRAFT_778328 [Sphaerobolus stellatus SS14]
MKNKKENGNGQLRVTWANLKPEIPLPQVLVNRIVDFLHSHRRSLKSCHLVNRQLSRAAKRHIFNAISLNQLRSRDFMEIATSDPDIRTLVRRVTLSDSGYDDDPVATDVLGKLFPSLSELILVRSELACMLNFPRVRNISIRGYDFFSTLNLIEVVALHPNLDQLELIFVSLLQESLPTFSGTNTPSLQRPNRRSSRRLSSLTLFNFHELKKVPLKTVTARSSHGAVYTLIEGLKTYNPAFELERLVLTRIRDEDVDDVNDTLERLGHQLRYLEFDVSSAPTIYAIDTVIESLTLRWSTGLTTLCLPAYRSFSLNIQDDNPARSSSAIPRLLQTVTSRSLSKIIFRIHAKHSVMILPNLEVIDSLLMGEKFPNLREVHCELIGSTMAGEHFDEIRQKMPSSSSSSKLFLSAFHTLLDQ